MKNDVSARRLACGALAGAAGWLAMDQVLRFLYNHERPAVQAREDHARGGIPALERMAEEMAGSFGSPLSDHQRQVGGTILQWTTGIGAGVLYGALRGRLLGVSAGRGLVYGAAFSLIVDEGLIPLLGFASGPRAFPWQTHARGFLGHLAFGAVTEAALETLDPTASGNRRFSQRASSDHASRARREEQG